MYVNSEHFLFFLDGLRRQKEAQPISRPEKQDKQPLELKIPAYTLIGQLAKSNSLMAHHQIIELLSFNTEHFSYRQLIDWVGSLPFGQVKTKSGKERRLCGVWELKKILKLDLTMLGWVLIDKYSKTNILSKCLVVDGMIETAQLNQVFLSEAIFRLILDRNA